LTDDRVPWANVTPVSVLDAFRPGGSVVHYR